MTRPGATEIEVVPAGPEHEEQILALGRRALGWGDDPRFTDLYRWKHDQNPAGPSPRWVALAAGEVVGFRVFLRWRFQEGDRVLTAVRAVDTATDPAHQGQGIFRRLTLLAVDAMVDEGVDFVFNSPNDKSRPGYLKMGWVEWGRPRVGVLPRVGSLARIARSRTAAEHWSTPSTVGVPAGAHFATAHAPLPRRPDRPDATWATEHTPAFLAWRYGLEHLDYRLLTTGDLPRGDRLGSGLVVFRTRRRGPSLEATVAEVLAPDERARRALVRAALRASGADYALVGLGGRPRLDATPTVPSAAFSPVLTWRALGRATPVPVTEVAFSAGDLELF